MSAPHAAALEALKDLHTVVTRQNRLGASWHPELFDDLMSALSKAGIALERAEAAHEEPDWWTVTYLGEPAGMFRHKSAAESELAARNALRPQEASKREVLPVWVGAAPKPAETAAVDTRKPCTCDGAGRGPGRACVVKAGGRLGELWRCAQGATPGPLPDPLGCKACMHPTCGRFDGPRQVECSAMAEGACARPRPDQPAQAERQPIDSIRYWLNAYSDRASGPHFMGHGIVVKMLGEYLAMREAEMQAPTLYVSPEQMPRVVDSDDESGTYLPVRRTPAGKFTLGFYAAPQPGAAKPSPILLTDQRVDHLADLVVKGMPEGIQGFCKVWGWRQFARALLADTAGHTWAPPPRVAWEEVLLLVNQYAMGVHDAAEHQAASLADISKSSAAQALVKLRQLYTSEGASS
jgi:hypothetical protein